MGRYKYRPLRFYATCFLTTWIFWIPAAVISKSQNDNGTSALLTILLAAVIVVLTNKEIFFEKDHIGNLLHYKEERKIKE